MTLNKTKIEYVNYTWNPVTGCLNGCFYCYAKKIYKRFKIDFTPQYHSERIREPLDKKKPSKILVCSMADLFGDWINKTWIEVIIDITKQAHWHTFMFLTKNPKRYTEFDFPKNCWLGVTIDGKKNLDNFDSEMWAFINEHIDKNIKFISYEPLLYSNPFYTKFIHFFDWIIIGGLTPKPKHKKEWVEDIIKEARFHGKPIFIKNNLRWHEKIQEYPK